MLLLLQVLVVLEFAHVTSVCLMPLKERNSSTCYDQRVLVPPRPGQSPLVKCEILFGLRSLNCGKGHLFVGRAKVYIGTFLCILPRATRIESQPQQL